MSKPSGDPWVRTICAARAPSTHPFGICVRPAFHCGDHESSRLSGVPMGWPRFMWWKLLSYRVRRLLRG